MHPSIIAFHKRYRWDFVAMAMYFTESQEKMDFGPKQKAEIVCPNRCFSRQIAHKAERLLMGLFQCIIAAATFNFQKISRVIFSLVS